ncbi:hypothetical protein C8R47DRAFT_1312984 [Mycena vitilis]|nr:hypothetical protein C8R47DRAFT_1312984 [Mycena vitilis]
MTSTSSAPNMVPAIASTALPSTPASEWAEGMNDILGSHVTRTPVTTPGPAVPGGFPAHLEPDPQPVLSKKDSVKEAGQGQGGGQDGSLIETAQAYLPTLATAKAYLPQGVAAYLPSPEPLTSEASLPPLPPSNASLAASSSSVSVPTSASASSTSTLPTTIDSHPTTTTAPAPDVDSPYFPRTAPSPDRGATDDSVALSTMAHTGHSYSSTSPSLSASTASPALVQSPPALPPRESTDLALAAEHLPSHPSQSQPSQAHSSPPPSFSLSSSSLTQERDAAVHAQLAQGSNENVHTVPTASLQGAHSHSHPHAVPGAGAELSTPHVGAASSMVATPPGSLPSLDSGYAASTESESLATPPSLTPLNASAIDGAHTQAYGGLAEPETPVPTPVVPAGAQVPVYGVPGQAGEGVRARVGLAGAGMTPNPSLDPSELHPVNAHAAEAPTPVPAMDRQSSSVDGDDEGDESPENDEADEGEGEGKDAEKKKSKKPKLMQRLKEKMHVGGGSTA